jgi:hypothetical protein
MDLKVFGPCEHTCPQFQRFHGHCGIHGNEDADALARAELRSAFVGPEPCLSLAPSSVRQREREWLLNHTAPHGAWRLLVVSRESGEKSKPGLTRYLLKLLRSKLRILVGLKQDTVH